MMPIAVGVPRSVKLVRDAMQEHRLVALVTSHDPEIDEPTTDQVHTVGGLGFIQRAVQGENDSLQLIVHVVERIKITEWVSSEPYLKARVQLAPDLEEEDTEAEALSRSLIEIAQGIVQLTPNVPNQVGDFLEQVESHRLLVYVIAANGRMDLADR